MPYSNYRELIVDVDDRIATVTMNRPEKLNAVSKAMHGELATIFQDLNSDAAVDVIILTGAGRAFSAGGDVAWFQEMIDDPDEFDRTAKEGKQIIFSLLDCEKPVIAKINGHAMGLGATLALFCDVIFAANTAKIGDPHVSVGFVAGDGGAVIWPQLIGYARAKEYLMTGDPLKAPEAARIGLINHAVADDELEEHVARFARRLCSGATKAIRWTKVCANIGLKQLAHSMMDACLSYEALSNRTVDHQEAVNAFRQGREPHFVGH
ncbi:enoyl-CoA hydratase [Aminobacter aminovorans]|uniref:Probable enoyl-CoA hydratase echA8 n=1 Tax=Aminobacter aminovorans TaxID=83263 RepID=A0A381IL11_AMIAI|nr:enoyl-CoA hydratase-related protein [Aminobacter aminovorans]TCS25079.1 enoyl-CoA hydratase [Aminobacter aminovorans]SUY28410.1 Probable enoyl-CoA hydratase echA8 [Aminobacter aminovorans]